MKRLADEFMSHEGPGLQRLLWLKSWLVPNYVTDWWERFVYLRGRDPLMINSNFYILDFYEWRPTSIPSSRAANMVQAFLKDIMFLRHQNGYCLYFNTIV